MTTGKTEQERHTLDDSLEAVEYCYRMGWTDGLPVVPPTNERVQRFLAHAGVEPSKVVLVEPVAGHVVTAEKAAANAVMAGCLPEYFPIVLAALDGMGEPAFNLHGATLTTSGMAIMEVVNGPIIQKIGLNTGIALFCPGNRANSTIGRALNLVLWNCTGNRPEELDKTIFGHAGRYSMCIAEREEALPPGWAPFHVERGLPKESSAVTVFTAGHPIQTGGGSSDPKVILRSIAEAMKGLGPLHKELLMVLAPEILHHLGNAKWSKANVKEFLFTEAGRPARDFQGRRMAYTSPEKLAKFRDDEMVPTLERPDALDLVAGGGDGGSSAIIVQPYGNGVYSQSVTREIKGA